MVWSKICLKDANFYAPKHCAAAAADLQAPKTIIIVFADTSNAVFSRIYIAAVLQKAMN
jgi:hypothetical protein